MVVAVCCLLLCVALWLLSVGCSLLVVVWCLLGRCSSFVVFCLFVVPGSCFVVRCSLRVGCCLSMFLNTRIYCCSVIMSQCLWLVVVGC